jgi:L-fucose mutarotase
MGILKGLSPTLTADLLYVLRAMGHGDCLCVCDANFPAASVAAKTFRKVPIVLAGVELPEAVGAICSVLPLDYFVDSPAQIMSPQAGCELPPLGHDVKAQTLAAIVAHAPDVQALTPIDRFTFYAAAGASFAIVQTAERRPYGNVILTKGVIGADGNDLRP